MNNESIDDAFLREFLLGKVSDEERARIEDLFLIDPQAKERVLGVEQDLTDTPCNQTKDELRFKEARN